MDFSTDSLLENCALVLGKYFANKVWFMYSQTIEPDTIEPLEEIERKLRAIIKSQISAIYQEDRKYFDDVIIKVAGLLAKAIRAAKVAGQQEFATRTKNYGLIIQLAINALHCKTVSLYDYRNDKEATEETTQKVFNAIIVVIEKELSYFKAETNFTILSSIFILVVKIIYDEDSLSTMFYEGLIGHLSTIWPEDIDLEHMSVSVLIRKVIPVTLLYVFSEIAEEVIDFDSMSGGFKLPVPESKRQGIREFTRKFIEDNSGNIEIDKEALIDNIVNEYNNKTIGKNVKKEFIRPLSMIGINALLKKVHAAYAAVNNPEKYYGEVIINVLLKEVVLGKCFEMITLIEFKCLFFALVSSLPDETIIYPDKSMSDISKLLTKVWGENNISKHTLH